jgi:hypothetical protein
MTGQPRCEGNERAPPLQSDLPPSHSRAVTPSAEGAVPPERNRRPQTLWGFRADGRGAGSRGARLGSLAWERRPRGNDDPLDVEKL